MRACKHPDAHAQQRQRRESVSGRSELTTSKLLAARLKRLHHPLSICCLIVIFFLHLLLFVIFFYSFSHPLLLLLYSVYLSFFFSFVFLFEEKKCIYKVFSSDISFYFFSVMFLCSFLLSVSFPFPSLPRPSLSPPPPLSVDAEDAPTALRPRPSPASPCLTACKCTRSLIGLAAPPLTP